MEEDLLTRAESVARGLRARRRCARRRCKNASLPFTKHCCRHQPWALYVTAAVLILLGICKDLIKDHVIDRFKPKSAAEQVAEKQLKQAEMTPDFHLWLGDVPAPSGEQSNVVCLVPFVEKEGFARFSFAIQNTGNASVEGGYIMVTLPTGCDYAGDAPWMPGKLTDHRPTLTLMLDNSRSWYPNNILPVPEIKLIRPVRWMTEAMPLEIDVVCRQFRRRHEVQMQLMVIPDRPELPCHKPVFAFVPYFSESNLVFMVPMSAPAAQLEALRPKR